LVPGLEIDRHDLALVGGGEYQVIVDRGAEPQPQLHLFLAAAHLVAPQLLHR
jgi:hypothetical protein